jgi:hypothetical protein
MFITLNMTSDGHDTSVTVAVVWLKAFLAPLLDDKNSMQNTLVLITFDENETYTIQSRVFSVLLGDALPSNLIGQTDSNFNDHCSATVEAEWYVNSFHLSSNPLTTLWGSLHPRPLRRRRERVLARHRPNRQQATQVVHDPTS